MMTLIAAALAAAQPSPTPAANPSANAPAQHPAQHQQTGHMGMSEKEMADCHECCEKMMAKMREGHAKHSGPKPK